MHLESHFAVFHQQMSYRMYWYYGGGYTAAYVAGGGFTGEYLYFCINTKIQRFVS